MRTEEPQNAKTSSSSSSHQMWCGGKLFFYCGNRNDHWWPALSFSFKVLCNFMSNEAPELSHHYQIAKGRSWSAAVLFCTRHQNTGTPLRPLPGLIFFTAEEQGRKRRRRRRRSKGEGAPTRSAFSELRRKYESEIGQSTARQAWPDLSRTSERNHRQKIIMLEQREFWSSAFFQLVSIMRVLLLL